MHQLPSVLLRTATHLELQTLFAYMSREPTPTERIEWALAQLAAITITANLEKGKPRPKITDLMLFREVWKFRPDTGDPEIDADIRTMMDSFGKDLVVKKRKKPSPE